MTLIYMFVLIIFSYSADKINGLFEEKKKTEEEKLEEDRKAEISIKKNNLRALARTEGESVVLEVA